MFKAYKNLIIILSYLLLVGCSQSNDLSFPVNETEYLSPKVIKATPSIVYLSDSIVNKINSKENKELEFNGTNMRLEKPTNTPITFKKTLIKDFEKHSIPDSLPKAKYTWDKEIKGLIKRSNDEPLVESPIFALNTSKPYPIKGKVIISETALTIEIGKYNVKENDQFGIMSIQKEHGLPGIGINCIIKDSLNRIWAGTDAGLVFIDGSKMKIYDIRHGLSNTYINCLALDGNKLWIGTNGGGVNLFENGTFTHFTSQNGLSSDFIISLAVDNERLWIGTFREGLDLLENNHVRNFNVKTGLSDNNVKCLTVQDDKLWIGTANGLNLLYNNQFKHYNIEQGLSNNVIRTITLDDDKLWIGTNGGLNLLKDKHFTHYTTKEGLSSNQIRSVIRQAEKLWVGTLNRGLNLIKNNTITHYTEKNGLSNNFVKCIIPTGNTLWIGTYGGGINLLKEGQFKHYTSRNGLSDNNVMDILIDDNKYWVATFNNGLNLIENEEYIYHTESILNSSSVFSLSGINDKLVIGTLRSGFFTLEGKRLLRYTIKHGLNRNQILSTYTEQDKLWVGTVAGGVNLLGKDKFTHITSEEGLTHDNILTLEKEKNRLWIGTDGGGLNLLDSNRIYQYSTKNGLSNNVVLSLLAENGKLWIGTQKGLSILENGYFTQYTIENGLEGNIVTQLSKDASGNVWVGTNSGLTCFKSLEDGYHLTTWNHSHGFKHTDFNGPSNPISIDKKGVIWTSVGQALTAFSPPKEDLFPPKLFITDIEIARKEVQWLRPSDYKNKTDTLYTSENDTLTLNGVLFKTPQLEQKGISWNGIAKCMPYFIPKNLVLPFNQNHLTLHYSAIKHGEQNDIVFRYKLEGPDNEWSSITKELKAEYRNVPPGHHTFRVRARGRNLIWSEEATFSFVVAPPWWQTWWAYLFYSFILYSIIHFTVVVRTRLLEERKETLAKLIKERTIELEESKQEISAININLEQMVQERTINLENRNKILESYASFNSHELRAHVARLLGLVELLKSSKHNSEDFLLLLDYLYSTSEELDALTRKMQKILEGDNFKS